MKHKYATAIVGARGYSGLELARILLKHPHAQLTACFATDADFALSDYLSESAAAAIPVFAMLELEKMAAGFHTVFLATPAEVSMELAPKLLKAGAHVIDLSGAFRLKGKTPEQTIALYKEWYGFEHSSPELVAGAHYGLVPWSGPANKAGKPSSSAPSLTANPGCYATSVLMGLLPLLKAGLIDTRTLVIDAKSGTTGAGRKAAEALQFSEVAGECLPYKIGSHQHFPEICGYAAEFAAQTIDPLFSTHLMNTRRGIISGIYARLASHVSPDTAAAQLASAFASAYDGYPLVKISALTAKNERSELSLKKVAGSARVHLRHKLVGDKLYVFSLIDNLLKGAASQAVENFNRLVDLPVHTALTELEGIL